MDRNVQDGYRFLCLNYEKGDEIYLFGFSRGAYTVRSLAGIIYCLGLVSRINIRKSVDAYKLYRKRAKNIKDYAVENFHKKYGQDVKIKLLGCWDTVGSLGIPDRFKRLPFNKIINRKYKFHDHTLSPIIENALHAVAIDECRGAFDVTPMHKSKLSENQELHQVWFPGDHGSIGGGDEKKHGLSDGALEWMISEIRNLKLGLDLDESIIPYKPSPDHLVDFKKKVGFFYWLISGKKIRNIFGPFENVHESAKKCFRDRSDYRPKNLKQIHGSALETWARSNKNNNSVLNQV